MRDVTKAVAKRMKYRDGCEVGGMWGDVGGNESRISELSGVYGWWVGTIYWNR